MTIKDIYTKKTMSTNKETKINKTDFEFLEKALIKADKLTKANNGHDYVTTLKTICQSCGHKESYKKRCPNWFSTFINKLKFVYLNPGLLETDTLMNQKNKKNKKNK